ncbi:hypothetical protein YC2023_090251 [Brassica napus]
MKAGLDCTLLSLEFLGWKDKQRLEVFLQECKEDRLKMSKELDLMREFRWKDNVTEKFADKDIIASPRPKTPGNRLLD